MAELDVNIIHRSRDPRDAEEGQADGIKTILTGPRP